MRSVTLVSMALLAGLGFASQAQAGNKCGYGKVCYKQVKTGPVYDTVHEQVLVRKAKTVKRRVPALLQDITEDYVVSPERSVRRHVPAEYATVHERVMTHPGGKVWQTRRDAHGNLIGCWVKVKPTYATIAKTVLKRPAGVVHDTVPAVIGTRTRTVVLEPARTVSEHVPAEYAVRERHVMVSAGSTSWQPISGSRGCGRGLVTTRCR
jgi:hypothetical protein